MSSFTTKLTVNHLDDGISWEVAKPFIYRIGSPISKELIIVSKGFITDFASIPKIFWSILHPTGKYGKAAVLHDFLYKTGIFSREKSDKIFLEAMGVLKVGWFVKHLIYGFVRLFGQKRWDKCRKDKTYYGK